MILRSWNIIFIFGSLLKNISNEKNLFNHSICFIHMLIWLCYMGTSTFYACRNASFYFCHMGLFILIEKTILIRIFDDLSKF